MSNASWLKGRVVSGFGGFYQVLTESSRTVTCKGRGRLKKEFQSILTGDLVEISRQEDGTGMIESIRPRRSVLPRPHIANVDLALIVLAWKLPDYDLLLLDNLLLAYRLAGVETALCFNKCDLMTAEEEPQFAEIERAYAAAGCPALAVSANDGRGLAELRSLLKGRLSVLAGPSGVGKSSLLNRLIPGEQAETGEVSDRLRRGRHTTRYTRLLQLPDCGGMLADSPGFFVLETPRQVTKDLLPTMYPEYVKLAEGCRFDGCRHHKEPECAVRAAVEEGRLDQGRYRRYLRILSEITEREEQYK
ncbi:MAG: ribosome small subunit-dependent GTPase A [Firmicutes bacterium]|nr:ribosome small subunit-dependent GTPase A [Bacillota bacterium]MBQ6536239.1 ribosome small subunit-dependent GTPase A [Bacillota bacterium]MBR0178934.1 ribosome small subunit-dependent GTPase A [Bacillota bacterium]